MNKKGMSYTSIIFIMIALTLGALYAQAESSGLDTQNITTTLETTFRNATNINLSIDTPMSPEIGNAISYYVNGLFLAMGEIGIWITHFVADNPQAPYKLLFYGLILSIFAPIIIILFKFLVIVFLLVKEYLQNRRNKKELNKIKEKT